MSGTLFLAHRLPFPPDRGDKIRSHHILRALARLGPVHVGCFAESAADQAHEGELAALAESHWLGWRNKPLPLAGAQALLRRKPVSLTAFHDRRLADWVAQTLAREDIGAIYVFSGQMGQYVPDGWAGRLVVDLCDVDSAKFDAYAAAKPGTRGWIDRREARLLRAEEARLAARADATLLISAAEAALLHERLPDGSPARIEVLGNGIDADFFDPAGAVPHRALAEAAGPQIVFTGQMDYAPNVAAVQRMAAHILPAIRARHPGATFHVVGRRPVPELLRLDGQGGCRIWGEVPDVRPFLAGADLVAAPLDIARGVQNKVLEAMAMARPVLLTPEAATGIDASDGRHCAIAASDAALVDRALELLGDGALRELMGSAARRFVVETMSWPAMLAKLPRLIGAETEHRDAA